MKRSVSFLLVIYMLIILCACESDVLVTKTLYCFDTTVEITFKAPKGQAKTVEQEITRMLYLYNDLVDNFSAKDINNIYMINHTDDFVEVSDELINLIKFALKMQDETDGYFNPLLGNITNLYKELITSQNEEVLALLPQELDNLQNSTLLIEGNSVKIVGNATIDLGGVAKGYALNEVVKYLTEQKIKYYLINCGYSSIALGIKDNKAFRVGLKYDDKILSLKNTTIGCCSIHEQKTLIGDKLYHHIINPKTGLNENHYTTIYLIGLDPAIIDAFATSMFNMSIDAIDELANKYQLKYLIYQNDEIAYNNYE